MLMAAEDGNKLVRELEKCRNTGINHRKGNRREMTVCC